MKQAERTILARCVTDIDGTLYRFGGNEAVYITCLRVFLEDTAMALTETAFEKADWDAAQAEAHSLKGCAGNMGFQSLMKSADRVVSLLKSGQQEDAMREFMVLKACYGQVTAMIEEFLRAGESDSPS